MTAQELQKRSERAEKLRVLKVNPTTYFVESAEGKIAYRINFSDDEFECSCGDWARHKTDENFRCKHILALMNCETGQMLQTDYLEKKKPKLKESAITNIKGKDFVVYSGVLDMAHALGLQKLEVELLQYPTKDNGNEAICRARAVSKIGAEFVDIGDASHSNVATMISPHIIRMASTRAKARVLRDMCNVHLVALEELGDFDDVIGAETTKSVKQKKKTSTKKSNNDGKDKTEPKAKSTAKKPDDMKTSSEEPISSESKGPSMSEAQKRALMNLSRRRGINIEEVEKMSMEKYQLPWEELSSKSASEFIRHLQQAA